MFLSCVFAQTTSAQLPEVSTAANPVWYYIQVLGNDGTREDRVWSANSNNYLYGEALSKTSDAQLFRFEKSGNNYYIISKSANKKADVAIFEKEETLSLTDAGAAFTLDPLGENYYNITATQTPVGGDVTKKYTHQSNSNSSFKMILVNTTWNTTDNSKFNFVPYDAVNLTCSDVSTETWYYITGASKAYESKYVTDITISGSNPNFAIKEKENNNTIQQWKLIKKAGNDNIDFVNRSTGNVINTSSTAGDLYNNILFASNVNETTGWTMTYCNGGQYIISGVEEDGHTRYWKIAVDNQTPSKYEGNNLAFSDFAWKIKKVQSDNSSSIPNPFETDKSIVVYSRNNKIIVEGETNYTIYTIQGIQMKKTAHLPGGIYLVSVKNKIVKLLVK